MYFGNIHCIAVHNSLFLSLRVNLSKLDFFEKNYIKKSIRIFLINEGEKISKFLCTEFVSAICCKVANPSNSLVASLFDNLEVLNAKARDCEEWDFEVDNNWAL